MLFNCSPLENCQSSSISQACIILSQRSFVLFPIQQYAHTQVSASGKFHQQENAASIQVQTEDRWPVCFLCIPFKMRAILTWVDKVVDRDKVDQWYVAKMLLISFGLFAEVILTMFSYVLLQVQYSK